MMMIYYRSFTKMSYTTLEQQIGQVMTTTMFVLLLLQQRFIEVDTTTIEPSVTTITADAPSTCPSVCFCDETHYVNCVGDGLWDVPTTDIPRTVVRLELRNYVVGVLTMSNVQELVELVELKLQQTKIERIENGTFGNLTRLLRLDLSQNLMVTIVGAMFEGLSNLRYLDLSTNRVIEMDEAFINLINLEQLNIRDNLLPSLDALTFNGLYKVQYLNLDSNRITRIEVGTFQYLTNLAHLIVSNNPLMALSRLDFFGSRLQYIDVSRVELTRVPQSLTRYVRDLRLAKNNLTHVRLGDLDSYPYLSLLVLDDNFLVDIESDALGRQEYLMRLWLNGNRLTHIPANLPPSLRVLYIEENLLKVLAPYSFQGLFNMEQLFLQRNQIRRLDQCAFCDLTSLKHLDLQANLLETIHEGVFANLSNLISLDLSQNPLKLLSDGCFNGLDSLKTLQLSRMKTQLLFEGSLFDPLKKLETLELYDSPLFTASLVNTTRALQGLRSLRELNVMHNNLASLRPDFQHFFPQLKVAKLSDNQWYCDASILWLADWVKKKETNFYHSYSILCSQPPHLLDKPIMMLKMENFLRNSTITVTEQPKTTLSEPSKTKITTSKLLSTPLTKISIKPLQISTESSNENHEMDSNSTEPSWNVSTSTGKSKTNGMTTTMPPIDFITTRRPTGTSPVGFQSELTSKSFLSTTTSSWTSTHSTFNEPSNDSFVSFEIQTTTESFVTDNRSIEIGSSKPNIYQTTDAHMKLNKTLPKNRELIRDSTGVDYADDQDDSRMVVAILLAIGLVLLLLGVGVFFIYFIRCRKHHLHVATTSSLNCQMRRSSSSISYSPHTDEVSIVSVSQGTVGLHTLAHRGLSNKLYFVLENGGSDMVAAASTTTSTSRELTREALPDPTLCELLPDSTNCYPTLRQKRLPTKKFRSYCFDK